MLDGAYALAAKQIGKNTLHHPAVGQHIGNSAGNAQVVFENYKLAAGHSDQVRPDHRDIYIARHLQPTHLAAEVSAAIDDLAGYDAVGENAAFVVNIAQEEIEGGDALGQAAFDAVPLRAGNQAGQQIIRKDFLGPFLAPVNRAGNALVRKAKAAEGFRRRISSAGNEENVSNSGA